MRRLIYARATSRLAYRSDARERRLQAAIKIVAIIQRCGDGGDGGGGEFARADYCALQLASCQRSRQARASLFCHLLAQNAIHMRGKSEQARARASEPANTAAMRTKGARFPTLERRAAQLISVG